jgi:hypothetical protein
MYQFRNSFPGSLVFALLIFAVLQGALLILGFHDLFSVTGQNLGGILALPIILAFLEFRRKIADNRANKTIQFLARFFENRDLDAFRSAVEKGDDPSCPIDDDMLLGMNLLETLAVSTENGHFDIDIVDASLGKFIEKLGKRPVGKQFRKQGNYGTFFGHLAPKILEMRGPEGKYDA